MKNIDQIKVFLEEFDYGENGETGLAIRLIRSDESMTGKAVKICRSKSEITEQLALEALISCAKDMLKNLNATAASSGKDES